MRSSRSPLTATLFAVALGFAAIGSVRAADAPAAAAAVKPYPLAVCIVSDEKIGGEMGPAVKLVHDGQEYQFCCKACIKDFNKDPAKYAKKLQDVEAAQAAAAAKPAHAEPVKP